MVPTVSCVVVGNVAAARKSLSASTASTVLVCHQSIWATKEFQKINGMQRHQE